MIKATQRIATSLSVALTALISAACSPVNLLNSVIPSHGYQLHANIAYGHASRQRLDVYQPVQPTSQKRPVIVFFYGGSWDSGDKKDYLFVAEAFTSKGFVTVIPDYRVYPEVKFPQVMEDPAYAAKWVKLHIAEFGGDANQVYLVGHSAGAHLAVMLGLNASYLDLVGLHTSDFKATIGLAGPYDFLPLTSDRLKTIFGPEEVRWQSQPIAYVNGQNQPMLLLVGMQDGTVWPRNSINLANKIKAHQGPVQMIQYPRYGHIDMVAKLAKPLRGNSTLLEDVVHFILQQSTPLQVTR